MMDTLDLRILVELFETHSISKVSKNLPLSYSAINARLANIENEVRVPLFIRTNSGTDFTDAGQKFYYFAYKSLLALETGLSIVRKDKIDNKQEVQIGVTRPLVHIVAPVISDLMNEESTYGNWNIQTGYSLELMLLTNGEALNMAIINQNKYITDGLLQTELFKDTIHLVGKRGRKLPDYSSLFHVLERIPLILLKKGFPLRELIEEEIFKPMGFVPKKLIEVDSAEMVKQLVAQGVGFSFLPLLSIHNNEFNSDIVTYSDSLLTQKFYLIYSSSFAISHEQLIDKIVKRIKVRVRDYHEYSSIIDTEELL